MPNSPKLALPYLEAAQAQKHVTVNESLRLLDAMVQLAVESDSVTAPPGSPANGAAWIVPAGATGAWSGWAGSVAFWADTAWQRLVPAEGWVAWNKALDVALVWTGAAWVNLGTGLAGSDLAVDKLAIGGATADATNRLSVVAAATMLNHAGAGHELKINKINGGADAGVSLSMGWSVRAILGLLASNDFTLRVSDGVTMRDALVALAATGVVLLPAGLQLGGLASDPGSPVDGQAWFNSTTGQLKARVGGRSRLVVDAEMPWLVPVTGDHVMTTCGSSQAATGTLAGAANRMDIYPFIPRSDLTIDQVAVNVTTGVASAQGKVVIYSADASGRPDALLLETGNLDLSTAAVASVAASITLREGLTYWIGIRHSSTATLSAWAVGGTPDINGGAPATAARKVLRRSLAYATAAPSTWGFTASEINAGGATAIWLRVA